MAAIFISHAAQDDPRASDLEAWLKTNGFTDLFVDQSSIRIGAKWADALRASAGACRVVVLLVSEHWLASEQCVGEFNAAWYMGKRIMPLFVHGPDLPAPLQATLRRVRAEDQGLDLTPFLTPEGRLDFSRDETRAEQLRKGLRAAGALAAVGLDPEAFEIDRALRPSPFPGLEAFRDEDADAALFFGRSREIAETLEELRAMRAASDRRVLMILGASGAGKSSLLKAGVIPRLRREAPAWIPLRAFRPGADPLLSFAEAITRTLADFGQTMAHGALRRTLDEAWRAERTAQTLADQAELLRAAANRPEATILIGLDQAEELARSEGESGEALAAYLRAAMDAGGDEATQTWRLAFTIRTDSFPELQAHPRFQGLEARGYDLRALPTFKFDDVVSQPAKRYGVEIDHALVDQLMEDAPGKDALPLLAFAMQRLWNQFAAQGRLGLADYRAMGGLSGLIEDAAERALCGLGPEQRDAPLPRGGASKLQDALGARTFVPPLADVNDEGEAIRRVAAWSEFGDDERALLDRFDRWRLVVKRGDAGAVEVAHEALFRKWPRLAAWLEPERARLEALRGLQLAAASWLRHDRDAAHLTHFGERLKAAGALETNPRFAPQLSDDARAYLAACRKAERAARRRRFTLQATAATLGLATVVGSLGYAFEFELRRTWVQATQVRPAVLASADIEALAPGDTFQECLEPFACPVMVLVPAGTFDMGSTPEAALYTDETPQRRIAVPAFAIGKYEVTHDEWETCVRHTKQETFSALDPDSPSRIGCAPVGDSGYGAGNRPVINVSWHDARAYVRWLNQMTSGAPDGPYRLPSEAEWEYAARAGAQTQYHWGDDVRQSCSFANTMTEATKRKYPGFQGEAASCEDGHLETAPVGSYNANEFGLHDMAGNVWEWNQDCFAVYEPARLTAEPVELAANTTDGCLRVLRGGSWGNVPQNLRSAYRIRNDPTSRGNNVGFRLARTL